MNRWSLRWRLFLAGAAAIAAALVLSAIGLSILFDRHAEQVAVAELEARAMTLIAMVEPQPGGGAVLQDVPQDPRYNQPFSGRYWQLSLGDEVRRSRSLWDFSLAPPGPPPAPGAVQVLALVGPQDKALLAVDAGFRVGADEVPLRIIVASDRDELTLARRAFVFNLVPFFGLLGAALLAASWVQVTVGLRPLARIGASVARLTSGAQARIGSDLPPEVVPLGAEIDLLLAARDAELVRARHRAADLAHGFKTPLQALLGDAQQLRDGDATGVADSIEAVATAMQRLVERELARTRLSPVAALSACEPAVLLGKLTEVLRRTPDGAALEWSLGGEAGLRAQIGADDLTEALGALLENAVRHARGRIEASVTAAQGQLTVRIRDDGPGVDEADLGRLVQRGLRLDQSGEGHGIGLSIAAEIVENAGGRLEFRNGDPGLVVDMHLPAARV